MVGAVDRYLEVNRASWDERAPAHANSPDYDVERFVQDPDFISDVVRFDLPRLGEVRGRRECTCNATRLRYTTRSRYAADAHINGLPSLLP